MKRHLKVHEPSSSDNGDNVDSYPCYKCDMNVWKIKPWNIS